MYVLIIMTSTLKMNDKSKGIIKDNVSFKMKEVSSEMKKKTQNAM